MGIGFQRSSLTLTHYFHSLTSWFFWYLGKKDEESIFLSFLFTCSFVIAGLALHNLRPVTCRLRPFHYQFDHSTGRGTPFRGTYPVEYWYWEFKSLPLNYWNGEQHQNDHRFCTDRSQVVARCPDLPSWYFWRISRSYYNRYLLSLRRFLQLTKWECST